MNAKEGDTQQQSIKASRFWWVAIPAAASDSRSTKVRVGATENIEHLGNKLLIQ